MSIRAEVTVVDGSRHRAFPQLIRQAPAGCR